LFVSGWGVADELVFGGRTATSETDDLRGTWATPNPGPGGLLFAVDVPPGANTGELIGSPKLASLFSGRAPKGLLGWDGGCPKGVVVEGLPKAGADAELEAVVEVVCPKGDATVVACEKGDGFDGFPNRLDCAG
jgi:hypothetical protein